METELVAGTPPELRLSAMDKSQKFPISRWLMWTLLTLLLPAGLLIWWFLF